MATNIPPHNMIETIKAAVMQIDNPEVSVEELLKVMPGPDFPTGATIMGTAGIRSAYNTGRGLLKVRAKTVIEEKNDRQSIIISEIPYQLNKSLLIEEIAALATNHVIPDISDIRDESDRNGMRVVIELKKNANPEVVLNQLYSRSRMESTVPVALIALVDGAPRTLTLKQLLQGFISHRKSVVTRRTTFDLNRAEERLHLVLGLIIALNNIEEVVKLIRASENAAKAKEALMQGFSLSEKQSLAVLDMRLQKLSSLEQKSLHDEQRQLAEKISALREILGSEQKVWDIIKSELAEISEKYGDQRRTEIVEAAENFSDEDLIRPEEVAVSISHSGYAKRTLLDAYKQQRRGGKGVIAASTREGDFVEHVFVANTHSYILFFHEPRNGALA